VADPLPLLAAAVRISLGSTERPAWPEGLDAAAAVTAADEHGVLMLLHRALPSIDAPPALQAALRPLVRERTERALLLVRQLRTLVALLEAEGIAVLPVKGPLLAVLAYRDVAMRGASGDLDLVVRPSELARAVATLRNAGYRRVEPASQEHDPERWSREAHLFPPSASIGTLVEIHTDLSGLPLEAVMERAQRQPLLGHNFRVLAPEDLLLYPTLHAAQHIWSRLIWTADIAALLRQPATIDWTTLLARATAIQARHRLAVTLRLAIDLFHAEVPGSVQAALFHDPRVPRTARLAHRRMRQVSAGVKIPRGFSGLLLRARGELAGCETPARRMTWLLSTIAPNAVDRAAFPLPRGLGWLRWILHPVRLLLRHEPSGQNTTSPNDT
jgi:hypothetical protein